LASLGTASETQSILRFIIESENFTFYDLSTFRSDIVSTKVRTFRAADLGSEARFSPRDFRRSCISFNLSLLLLAGIVICFVFLSLTNSISLLYFSVLIFVRYL
jgi:hypothetical protein